MASVRVCPAIYFLLQLGRLDDAAAELTRAAALSPRAAAPLVALGRAALRRRTPRAAATAFLAALERTPRCAPALTGLALVEWSRGRARAAEAHLALALRYEPGYIPALYDISLLWLSAGLVEDALAARERLTARLEERAAARDAGGAAAGRGAARGGPLPVPARLRGADTRAEYALTAVLHRLGLVQVRALCRHAHAMHVCSSLTCAFVVYLSVPPGRAAASAAGLRPRSQRRRCQQRAHRRCCAGRSARAIRRAARRAIAIKNCRRRT
jgi:tetratricopeptide (TPR) repeat protein